MTPGAALKRPTSGQLLRFAAAAAGLMLVLGGMWTVLYASWALAMPLLIIAGALFWYAQAPEGRTGKGFGEWSRLLSMEFIGEVLLLALVGATFLYMLWDSQSWGTGAWLLPRIAIAFGMPLWVWRVASLFRQGMSDEGGQIMDTGFLDIEDSPAVVAGRWAQLVGTTGALLAGVWALGFHVAIPAYTIVYLIVFGRLAWYGTIPASAFFLAVIMYIYGYLLQAEWNIPFWVDWFGVREGWEDMLSPDAATGLAEPYLVGIVLIAAAAFATGRIDRGLRQR